MENNIDTFPNRRPGERWPSYVRRIWGWFERFKREVTTILAQKPIYQKPVWIEIENSTGHKELYINIREILGIEYDSDA